MGSGNHVLLTLAAALAVAAAACSTHRNASDEPAPGASREQLVTGGWEISAPGTFPPAAIVGGGGPEPRIAASASSFLVASFARGSAFKTILQFARVDAEYQLIDPILREVTGAEANVSSHAVLPIGPFAVASDGTSFLLVWLSAAGTELLAATVDAGGQVSSPFSIGPNVGVAPDEIALASDGTTYLAAWVDGAAFRGAHIDAASKTATPLVYSEAIIAEPAYVPHPSLAFNGTNYLLTWTSETQSIAVKGVLLQSDGAPQAPTVLPLDQVTSVVFNGSRATASSNGQDFVVVGEAGTGVVAQRVSAAGAKLGAALMVEAVGVSYRPPAVMFLGSNYVAVYDDAIQGRVRRSYFDPAVTAVASRATVPGSILAAAAHSQGGLVVTGAYAMPLSSQLEVGVDVLVSPRLAPRTQFRSAASGGRYLVAWNEVSPASPAPSFQTLDPLLKAFGVDGTGAVPLPLEVSGLTEANGAAAFGDFSALRADDHGFLLAGINSKGFAVQDGTFSPIGVPTSWPLAAGRTGYLGADGSPKLYGLDSSGTLLDASGTPVIKPCPPNQQVGQSCWPVDIAFNGTSYAVLWASDWSPLESEVAAITLTDEHGSVLSTKLLDAGSGRARRIFWTGSGYLVFLVGQVDYLAQTSGPRSVLQLDAELNVVTTQSTALYLPEFQTAGVRVSELAISSGVPYLVYGKDSIDGTPRASEPLWFAHLEPDGTLVDELEVIADTSGYPALATAGPDAFLLSTSASEMYFIRRDSSSAGAGGAPPEPPIVGGEGGAPADGGTPADGGVRSIPSDEAGAGGAPPGEAGASDGGTSEEEAASPEEGCGCRQAGGRGANGTALGLLACLIGLTAARRRKPRNLGVLASNQLH